MFNDTDNSIEIDIALFLWIKAYRLIMGPNFQYQDTLDWVMAK